MITFDLGTILLAFLIDIIICLVVMVSLWYRNRHKFAGLLLWVIACILLLTGAISMVVRDLIPLFSIMMSNLFLVGGLIALYSGLQKFYGIKATQIPNYLLLALVTLIQLYFSIMLPDLTVRNIVFNIASLILAFECAWFTSFKPGPDMRKISRELSLAFWSLGLVSLLRVAVNLIFPSLTNNFFSPDTLDLILIIIWGTLFIYLTICLVLVVNRRLAMEAKTIEQALRKDVIRRKAFEQELNRSREQLRNFSVYLQERIEEERKQLSAEIHDELGQTLTAMQIELSLLTRSIPSEPGLLRQKATVLTKLVKDAEVITKRITTGLRPAILDDLGLIESLRWTANQFQSRTGVECNILSAQTIGLDKDQTVNVFRIAQESLTNIARHAGATRVVVRLIVKNGKLFIIVKDNGRGIAGEKIADSRSFGLLGMRERAHQMGGKFKIKGIQGKGTIVILIMPYQGDRIDKNLDCR